MREGGERRGETPGIDPTRRKAKSFPPPPAKCGILNKAEHLRRRTFGRGSLLSNQQDDCFFVSSVKLYSRISFWEQTVYLLRSAAHEKKGRGRVGFGVTHLSQVGKKRGNPIPHILKSPFISRKRGWWLGTVRLSPKAKEEVGK